jgi:uncharacterized RmlC-like cupin family protein
VDNPSQRDLRWLKSLPARGNLPQDRKELLLKNVLLTAALGLALSAQSSNTVIENDQVKVLKVMVEPKHKTRLHEHKVNRVMIYLQPGKQTIAYQDGKNSELNWRAGEAKWSPASGMHIAEITSNQPVEIVEVELKKPAGSKSVPNTPLDPVKVDPKHYKVELDNEQVRVLRVHIGAGESTPVHEHSLNRVVTYLSDQKFRVTAADGKVENVTHKAGDVSWGSQAKHKEENLSDKAFEVVVVELKN